MTIPRYVSHILDRCEIGDCWTWTGYQTPARYGRTRIDGKYEYNHRAIWQALVGPIPDGLVIDHLCENRLCCNPDHLQTTTPRINVTRSKRWQNANSVFQRRFGNRLTRCLSGRHVLAGGNLYVSPTGARRCRPCKKEYDRVRYANR